MERAFLISMIGVSVLGVCGYGCTSASASAQGPNPKDSSVELTVYTQDFAQVSHTRGVDLSKGTTRISLSGVSHALDQSSVMYDWPDGSGAQVVSTTYDLGTSSGESLLAHLVGREVTLVYRSDSGREGERQEGILEVAAPGNVVVRVGDRLVINPNATIEATAGDVATMPALTATIENDKDENLPLNLSYMTRGLSWEADYVMVLGDEGSELECWATVTNKTGIDFPEAKIKFVAGAPNRAVRNTNTPDYSADSMVAYELERKPRVETWRTTMNAKAESLGELIAYPYESSATLRNNQTNRVLMMNEPKVKVTRDYSIRLPSHEYYGYRDENERFKATLAIAFKNSEEAGLGSPLPAGKVRVYEPAKQGAPVSIGAGFVANTPKDDRVDLTLSEVFNLYARGKIVKKQKLDKKRTSYTYEFKVFNEKEKAINVRLVADYYGRWTISEESIKSTRPNAGSAQWTVSVPARGETALKYTVIVG